MGALDDLDVVLEAVGERGLALQHVKRGGGRVASIVSGLPDYTKRYGANPGVAATGLGIAWFWLRGRLRGVDAATVVKRTHTDQLDALANLGLRVHVDRTFPLTEIARAHAYGETGRIRGKVVICP